ncbi:MAG: HdeD family acid-resistance protein [Anaerolineae bacterium]|jgi:uncharacterized membrane protein HdeD (DUF308 family)
MEEAVQFETRQVPWWLLLLGGILNVIVGILLLTVPGKTTLALVWVLGLYWLIQGIFTLVGMFLDHSAWGWKLFVGILGIIAGVLVMRHPIASALLLPNIAVLLLGIQGLIVGIVMIVMAFKGGGWGMGILGAVSIVFGIILILAYGELGTAAVFIWVVGIFAVVGGIAQSVQAFMQRRA